MRAVLQRVLKASVSVDGSVIGKIDRGLMILVGVGEGDTEDDARRLAEKSAKLRIFEDEAGKMNLSLEDTHKAALVVSQFTLLADCKKGRRPSFVKAAAPEEAERLYDLFVTALAVRGIKVETGRFRANMLVDIANDGPVTIILESDSI